MGSFVIRPKLEKCVVFHIIRSWEPIITQYSVFYSPVNQLKSQKDLGMFITDTSSGTKKWRKSSILAYGLLGRDLHWLVHYCHQACIDGNDKSIETMMLDKRVLCRHYETFAVTILLTLKTIASIMCCFTESILLSLKTCYCWQLCICTIYLQVLARVSIIVVTFLQLRIL